MKRTSVLLIIIAYIAFISLGLPDGLLGVAWPSISTTFGLPLGNLGMLLVVFVSGFLLSSFNSGQIVARIGVGGLLLVSSLLITTSLFAYALAPAWWMMVAVGFLLGMGGGAIDAGLNAYAAAQFSPRHVNWLHACYGFGATLGPLLMTVVLSSGQSWRNGYALVGGAMAVLTLCFGVTRRLWQNHTAATTTAPAEPSIPVRMQTILRRPMVWLGIGIFFTYTGLEVTAGQWAYSLFTAGRGIDPSLAGIWISIYWGSLTVGRVVFGMLAERIGTTTILRTSMACTLLGALLLWLNPSPLLSFLGLALIGFMLAPIFPLLITQTPARLGAAHATHAIGFQVAAANLGSALIPAGAGLLVRGLGLEVIGPILLVTALLLYALHEVLVGVERGVVAEHDHITYEQV